MSSSRLLVSRLRAAPRRLWGALHVREAAVERPLWSGRPLRLNLRSLGDGRARRGRRARRGPPHPSSRPRCRPLVHPPTR